MYPELGHRPIERLGVSNRAYILERSVPYLASALSAGVVGLGPLLASMPKRFRGSRSYSLSDLQYLPTPAPTPVPTASGITSVSGDVSVITDPFNSVGSKVVLVGADTDRNFSAKVFLGNTSGWSFRPGPYRRSLLFRNPLTVYAGDIFTTGLSTSDRPGYITEGSYTAYDSAYDRHYDSTVQTVAKVAATANSALQVKCGYSNVASHFCVPVALYKSYGSNITGTRNVPFGLYDLFQTYGNYTHSEFVKQQVAGSSGLEMGPWSVPLTGENHVGLSQSADVGLYVSFDMQVTIHNPTDYSQTFELSYLTPRKDTRNSPLYDYHHAWANSIENIAANNGSNYLVYHPRRNIFSMKMVREKWRCIKKRSFQVAGKGTLKVIVRVPLSLIDYAKLQQVTDNGTTSVAGLTGWLYIRNTGLFGYDSQSTTDGGGVTNSAALGYAHGNYLISGEQKIRLLAAVKKHRPILDQRNMNLEGTDQTNFTENDENNEVTI